MDYAISAFDSAKIADILYLRAMKKFVFALLLSIPIIRLSFAQTEIIANDYYDIEFFDSNKSKDVPDEFDASNHENGFPYKIYDICIVSFDSQMNCIKTHIQFILNKKHWVPEMESYHGKIEFINDSILKNTYNTILLKYKSEMNSKISIFLVCMILLSGLFDGIHAQTVIGTFSDTVYLLSVFHNSGEKDNKAENYYCAVFLDKESATDSLLPLKTEECIHIRFDKRVKHLRLCHIVL